MEQVLLICVPVYHLQLSGQHPLLVLVDGIFRKLGSLDLRKTLQEKHSLGEGPVRLCQEIQILLVTCNALVVVEEAVAFVVIGIVVRMLHVMRKQTSAEVDPVNF